MGYKFKPNKGVAKRMKLTATGKLKHRHEKNSHLRSRRNASLKRRLGRPGILAEGHSRNMRKFLGVTGVRPKQIEHERAIAEKENSKSESQNSKE
jgi:large subunit ribosomal protein L35